MSEILIGPLGFSGAANGDERLIHFERFIKLFYLSTFCSPQLYFFAKYKIRNILSLLNTVLKCQNLLIKAKSNNFQKDLIYDQIMLIYFKNITVACSDKDSHVTYKVVSLEPHLPRSQGVDLNLLD